MRSYRTYFIVSICIIVLLFNYGCTANKKTPPQNVIAEVNGEEIIIEDIQKDIHVREIGLKLSKKYNDNPENDKDVLQRIDDLINHAKTDTEKHYYKRMKRKVKQSYSENVSFNKIIRRIVLYQEAKKQGYEVSIEEARKFKQELDKNTEKVMQQKENIEEFEKIKQMEAEAIKLSGFSSREEWFDASLSSTAKSLAISSMKQKFINVLNDKYPNIIGQEWIILKGNAWEEYTEYLLKKAKIKLYNNNFEVVYYEDDWKHESIDLKKE